MAPLISMVTSIIVYVYFVHGSRYVSGSVIPAKYAYVGLSVATTEGSWQTESKVITNHSYPAKHAYVDLPLPFLAQPILRLPNRLQA